jgi:hypothetical protein
MSAHLDRLAREFAAGISDLLNRTVTHGIRLSHTLERPDLAVAGPGIKAKGAGQRSIRLTTGARTPAAFLRLGYVLALDDDDFLTVQKSAVQVCADDGGRQSLVRYDYNARPANAYPAAHLQVAGESSALQAIRRRAPEVTAELERLHFPVGGRRFRPALEDVIEFLVVERMVRPHPGWEAVIEPHRRGWQEAQSKVVVRRHSDWASEALAGAGWTVQPPGQGGERS